MSKLLDHLLPSLSYVHEEHMVGMLAEWPHTDLAEAQQWWPVVVKAGHPAAVRMLHDRFDRQLWQTPTPSVLPLAHALGPAVQALASSTYSGNAAVEVALEVAHVSPTHVLDDLTVQARQRAWLKGALPCAQPTEACDALTVWTLTHAHLDLNAPHEGLVLGSLLRHPAHLEAWIAAGGDLGQPGWDPLQPERPGWDVLATHQPTLRAVLAQHIPAVRQQTGDLDRQDAYWKRLLREKMRADERWEALVSEPDWETFRSPKQRMPPLLCALQQSPSLLPKLIKAAKSDSAWIERLKVRDRNGAGLWETLARIANHRSVTSELVGQIVPWVPPQAERSVVLQGLKNGAGEYYGERRGALVVYNREEYSNNRGLFRDILATSVADHLGQGWLGQDADQQALLAFLHQHPDDRATVVKVVVEHNLASLLIPELRTLLLEQALTQATAHLKKYGFQAHEARAFSPSIRALGMGPLKEIGRLVAPIQAHQAAFDQALRGQTLSHSESLALQQRFQTLQRQDTLIRHPVAPARPASRRPRA